MDITLTPEEVRVLGALLEKSKTTPDNYPLSLNALLAACNQKTSRDPVVEYDEETVLEAISGLRHHTLIIRTGGPDARVPKYRDLFTDVFKLAPRHEAVLCVLMLRGPQTPGELKSRTGRLYEFASLEEVEKTLHELMETEGKAPFVTRLPRRPGTKEARYAHLFSGEPAAEALPAEEPVREGRLDRIGALEEEVRSLREEVETLKTELASFRRQFE